MQRKKTGDDKVTTQHISRAEGIMNRNDGKQGVLQPIQGWIPFGAASLAPYVLYHDPLGGGTLNRKIRC